jgi:membrane protein
VVDLDQTVIARPPRRDDGGPAFLGKLARYFHLAFRVTYEDGVLLTASALAFVTVLSLIPLLTALSFVGARVFSQYPQRSLEIFVQILPYSDKSIVDAMAEFLDQAATVHGAGVIAFFATTLYLFATVEETFNKIWNVSRRRPLRARLISFVLLIFWGPLLIGATFSSLIVLRQSPGFRRLFQESFLLNVLPFVATVVGLTILYWRVPYTNVRLRNALAGGLLTGILLEILREGFGSYVEVFRNVSIVYGSYAFALLFMISIDLTWTIILFGAVATYTAQHFSLLAKGLRRHPPVQAAWVGLAALALIARRFDRGEPPLSREALADRMCLPTTELERILRPMAAQGLLQVAGDHGYTLAADPNRIHVEEVLAAYDHRARRGAELVGGEISAHLQELIGDLAAHRAGTLGDLTVGGLLAAGDTPGGAPGNGDHPAALPPPAPPRTIPPSSTVGQ